MIVEFAKWIPKGFQTLKIRRPIKDTPKWVAEDDTFLRYVIGDKALKRLMVAYLYWRCGFSESDIHQHTGLAKHYIHRVINELRARKYAEHTSTNPI